LVLLFCCLPFGIAGLVYATQVNSKYGVGDYAGALEASKNAAKWTKIGFFVGIAVTVLSLAFFVFFGYAILKSQHSSIGGY
jgi:ABC-type glycerol-3-phosphate transport system permease component